LFLSGFPDKKRRYYKLKIIGKDKETSWSGLTLNIKW